METLNTFIQQLNNVNWFPYNWSDSVEDLPVDYQGKPAGEQERETPGFSHCIQYFLLGNWFSTMAYHNILMVIWTGTC